MILIRRDEEIPKNCTIIGVVCNRLFFDASRRKYPNGSYEGISYVLKRGINMWFYEFIPPIDIRNIPSGSIFQAHNFTLGTIRSGLLLVPHEEAS